MPAAESSVSRGTNSTTFPKLTATPMSSLETTVTQLGSLYFIFLHGIFLQKFIQLPFEPIYSPISTTSCGRTFHSFSVLCVCFELPGSCQKTKKKTDKKLGSFITSIYFSHAIMICDFFYRPPQPALQWKCPVVCFCAEWMLLHTSSSPPCIPLLHSFQVRLCVIFRSF